MNDLSKQLTLAGSAHVVILAGPDMGQALGAECVTAGYRVRIVDGAYAAAGELLLVERAVLVIDFGSPQFLQTGLLALAARRAIPVLKAGPPEVVVESLRALVPTEEAEAGATDVDDQEPDAKIDTNNQAGPGDGPADPAGILTREELAALLRREP